MHFPPTIVELTADYDTATARYRAFDAALVASHGTFEARVAACNACEFWQGRCTVVCMARAMWLASAACPKGRWPENKSLALQNEGA